jgi:hypothetical protein
MEAMTDEREKQTPPGTLTPDITAPDGGTTRGSPAGVGTAMRNVSLMTAVCSTLRVNSIMTNKHTCQVRELFELFIARSLVEGRPRGAHFVN